MKRYKFILIIMLTSGLQANDDSFLSDLEKEVYSEMNIARKSPEVYVQYMEERLKYFSGKNYKLPGAGYTMITNEGPPAVKEAIRVLKSKKPMPELALSRGMSLGAMDHVKDTGPKGMLGHSGSDKSNPFSRISRYGEWQTTAGENISYGMDKGREVVMQLIIDDGVKSRGHRKNIYNPAFNITGVACGYHKNYKTMCVITYAGGYTEKN